MYSTNISSRKLQCVIKYTLYVTLVINTYILIVMGLLLYILTIALIVYMILSNQAVKSYIRIITTYYKVRNPY